MMGAMTDPHQDAERIRQLRQSTGISQRELAELAGVDRSSVRRAEGGEPMSAMKIGRILAALERLAKEAGVEVPAVGDGPPALDAVIFSVLADYTSDMDWIDEAGAKLEHALRESGLLR